MCAPLKLVVDFAFVDSQRPDLPYHICKILQFKSVSRHSFTVYVRMCVEKGGLGLPDLAVCVCVVYLQSKGWDG